MIDARLNLKWDCPNGVRLDSLYPDLLQLMEAAGCEALAVGSSRCDDRTAQRAVPNQMSDSAEIARRTWIQAKPDLAAAISNSENGRRLLAIPELRDDVAFCLQRDIFPLVARMEADGAIRRQ